jgi:hypothetical protein
MVIIILSGTMCDVDDLNLMHSLDRSRNIDIFFDVNTGSK